MVDFSKHKASQAAQADSLGNEAAKVGLRSLASSTLELAGATVARATGSSSRAPVDEASADMADVRSDSKFIRALDEDLQASYDSIYELAIEAMEQGLDDEMRWQVTQFKGMQWKLTDKDRRSLRGFPVQGHTVSEFVKYMHDQLRYEVNGAVGAPLDGSTSVESTPESIGAIVKRFSDRCRKAVEEAYFAGVQLGVRTAAEAIANAR